MSGPHPLRAELRALVPLALPLAFAQGGQALMGVVDTAVAGRAGAVPLAGVGLGNALYFGIAIFPMGIMLGLDPLIAQAVGAGREDRAHHLLWQGAWLALALSVAFALPILALIPALEPLGIAPDVAAMARAYIWWRLPGLPFFLLYFAGRAYLQALGSTRPMVVAVVAANVVNLLADILFVFGGEVLPAWAGPLRALPAMGAAGSALATTLASLLQAALLFRAAAGASPGPRAPGLARPVRSDIAGAARIGLPTGLHLGAEMGLFALGSFLAGRLGATAIASHQIALALASLSFTFAVGFGTAGSVRVGMAVGARDRHGARRAGLAALGCAVGIMGSVALAFLLFPHALARLLTDDPEVLAAAAPLLRIAALFQVSDGLQGVGAGVLRGAGEMRFTFAANMVGHWLVGVPTMLAFTFLLGWGVNGLWLAFCVGLTAVAASLVWRFLRVSRGEIAPLATVGHEAPSPERR